MKRAALAKAGPVGDDNAVLAPWRSDASILEWFEPLANAPLLVKAREAKRATTDNTEPQSLMLLRVPSG